MAQLSSGRAWDTNLNFPSPLFSGLMGGSRAARTYKPRLACGRVALARLEREVVSVAVLADKGVTGLSRDEV
jgi:hypothetical protein